MNYHQPRQRLVDGKPSGVWDYTNYNDNQKAFWREGYCAGWPAWLDLPFDPEKDSVFMNQFRDQAGKDAYVAKNYAPFKAKYHDNGHASAEECYACKKEYDLDHSLQFHEDRPVRRVRNVYKWPDVDRRIFHKVCLQRPSQPRDSREAVFRGRCVRQQLT
jgi:hypothetical protein